MSWKLLIDLATSPLVIDLVWVHIPGFNFNELLEKKVLLKIVLRSNTLGHLSYVVHIIGWFGLVLILEGLMSLCLATCWGKKQFPVGNEQACKHTTEVNRNCGNYL